MSKWTPWRITMAKSGSDPRALSNKGTKSGRMQGAKLKNVEMRAPQQSQPSHPTDAKTGHQEQNEYFPAYKYTPS